MSEPSTLPLVEALAKAQMQPLWDRYASQLTRQPAPIDTPMVWTWQAMQPLIERAVREVSMAEAERRVLLLTHPAFAPQAYTTTNLSGGVQVLEPGEEADAHRHTVAALRFVMEGEGAATYVNGKRCEMAKGDLVLTPSWCWHAHRNEGDQRVVWFDGLDVPLAHHLRATFLEFEGEGAVPEELDDAVARAGMAPTALWPAYRHYSPRMRYAAADVAAALDAVDAQDDGARELRYVNPVSGGPVMPTLDCYALRLRAGAWTRAQRSTSNAIVVVASGSGQSRVGDQVIEWRERDVFTLPHWHWVSHRGQEPDSQLFLMTDRALLDAMGYLRTEQEA